MDDVWARHAEVMGLLRALEAKTLREKAFILAELEEAQEDIALVKWEMARLSENAPALES